MTTKKQRQLEEELDLLKRRCQKLAQDWEYYARFPKQCPDPVAPGQMERCAEALYEIVGRP